MPRRLDLNQNTKLLKLKNNDDYYSYEMVIPQVDDEEIIPKIRIYDPEGYYWFRKIGFNRKITDRD